MLDLDDKYPEVEMFGPQCISASVGAGWAVLLEDCLKVLSEHGCKAGQIKQKFCGMRIYWDFPDHIEDALNVWRAGHAPGPVPPPAPFAEERERIRAAVKPVLDRAEELSFRTCEDCGADLGEGKGMRGGRGQCQTCNDLDISAAKARNDSSLRGRG